MLVELNEMTCSNSVWTHSACTRTDRNSFHKGLIVFPSAGEHSPSILTPSPLALGSCVDADCQMKTCWRLFWSHGKINRRLSLSICGSCCWVLDQFVPYYFWQTRSLPLLSPHLCIIVHANMRVPVYFLFILYSFASLCSPASQQREGDRCDREEEAVEMVQ